MRSLAQCLPILPFPGYAAPKTHAAWPVWSDSTTKDVKFQPLPKKAAIRIFHKARDFDRRTSKPGCHGGAVGPAALQVLHALIFDFLNYASGRLDPSYEAIAEKANVCARTVASAVKRLRALGILNWVRRCREERDEGRFALKQETNAYAVLPPSQWLGYREPPAPPPPLPGTWGDHPPLPSVIAQAVTERKESGDARSVIQVLASDPTDRLAAALASLGRAMQQAKPQ